MTRDVQDTKYNHVVNCWLNDSLASNPDRRFRINPDSYRDNQ